MALVPLAVNIGVIALMIWVIWFFFAPRKPRTGEQ
jgi:hypothetical protein